MIDHLANNPRDHAERRGEEQKDADAAKHGLECPHGLFFGCEGLIEWRLAEEEPRVVRDLRVLGQKCRERGIRRQVVLAAGEGRIQAEHLRDRWRVSPKNLAELLTRLLGVGPVEKGWRWRLWLRGLVAMELPGRNGRLGLSRSRLRSRRAGVAVSATSAPATVSRLRTRTG